MLGFYERVVDQCIIPFCVNYECMMFLRVHYERVCYTFTSTLQVYYAFTRTLPVYYTFTSIHYECIRFPGENHEPLASYDYLDDGQKTTSNQSIKKTKPCQDVEISHEFHKIYTLK